MKYTEGYKYKLEEDDHYSLPAQFAGKEINTRFITIHACVITVKKGYAWDGASGPTVDTKNTMRGSLFHDALYQLMREGLLSRSLKASADNIMQTIMIEDGMWLFRAKYFLWGVNKFGKKSTIQNKDIKVAP